MSTQHKNMEKHFSKLRKSIDNKLFDLLIDLDDENTSNYQFKDINLILKYYILNKILYNKRCVELLKISDKTIHNEITIGKSKDNLIYITSILCKNKNEPDKGKNSYIICNNNYDEKDIIKKYSCDIKPLISFVNSQVENKYKNSFIYYNNNRLKFDNIRHCKNISFNICNRLDDNYSVFDNYNVYKNVINEENILQDEEPRDDKPAPKLVKINELNMPMKKNVDPIMQKYLNEKTEIKDYNNINVENMSEKEQLKLAIELSKKEYLNKFIEDSPKVEIDQLTGSITLTHKQRDRQKFYSKYQ